MQAASAAVWCRTSLSYQLPAPSMTPIGRTATKTSCAWSCESAATASCSSMFHPRKAASLPPFLWDTSRFLEMMTRCAP
ncbi:hypothetical protein DHEL01_v204965, partial [Diaporthe helianthi]